jgi:hypothetical protein
MLIVEVVATVNVPVSYVFTWTISNGNCDPSTADINVRFNTPPTSPVGLNRTECAQNPTNFNCYSYG